MRKICLSFLLLFSLSAISQPTIYYVKEVAVGANNGTSWLDASDDLQKMINQAIAGDTIWVAEGTYIPIRRIDNISTVDSSSRENTFLLKNGVVIMGGFPNTGSPLLEDRNWKTYPTILSGDLGGNNNSAQAAYHVVVASSVGAQTVLDGFIITGGYANGTSNISSIARNRGGGIHCYQASPKLVNLIIRNNYAEQYGGGICTRMSTSSPVIVNALIYSNRSHESAAGVNNDGSYPVFVNTTIAGNHTDGSAGSGTGGVLDLDAFSRYYNTIIWGNSSNTYVQIRNYEKNSNGPAFTTCLVGPTSNNFPGITVTSDPLFRNAAAGDYRLQSVSPAVNAGTNTSYLTGVSVDLGGDPRISGSHPDIGAYEYQDVSIIPDTNGIVYVNKHVTTGNGRGNSWFNAAVELGDALQAAKSSNAVKQDSIKQIWVAEATYFPMFNAADDSTGYGGRNNAFVMVKDVQVYGGFPTNANDTNNAPYNSLTMLTMEQARNTRNWRIYPTILSGDIGTENDNSDNCYHVVISTGNIGIASLDGFTITGGNANGIDSIKVNTLKVRNHSGGGVYTVSSSLSLPNDIIDNNVATNWGGGMYNESSSPVLLNVTLSNNRVNGSGGGIYNINSSSPLLTNVVVIRNNAGYYGGGILNGQSSSPVLTNVLVIKNTANVGGGIYNENSSPVLTNITVSGNVAGTSGGGIYNFPSSNPAIRNSIIWGNRNGSASESNVEGDSPVYLTSLVGGATITPGGIILNVDPLFIDTANGNYRLSYCSQAIDTGRNSFYDAGETPDLSSITVDLDSNDRFYNNGTVDLGAYEYQSARILPSLVLSGDTTICYGDSATISFVFDGTSPWQLVYTKDAGVSYDTVKSISNSVLEWKVSPTDTTTYKFVQLSDVNCKVTLLDSVQIMVPSEPVLTNIFSNDTLCHGAKTTPIVFTGTSTDFQWESNPSIDSIPAGSQTGNFGEYTVVNNTTVPITTTISIAHQYVANGITCPGKDTSFMITILPNPTVTNIPANDTLCNKSKTTPVVFTGTATNYQWESGTHIDSIPTGPQADSLDAYTVVNPGSSLLTTNIKVTPQYLFNGVTCNGKDTSFSISVLPSLAITNTLANDTLCHGSKTSAITFAGSAPSGYQWESGTHIDSIPTGSQTGSFGSYTVINTTSSPLTTEIVVSPQPYGGKVCSGNNTSFYITVLPNPTVTNIPVNDTLCYNSKTTPVAFTGASTNYQWETGTHIDSIPTGLQTGNFDAYTVVNPGSSLITTEITVHFQYVYGGVSCSGKDTTFSISVLPNMLATNIPANDTLCHGSKTSAVTFTGPAIGYQWESGTHIDSIPTGPQTGSFESYTVVNTTNSPLTTEIMVTPLSYNGKVCTGNDTSFYITVLPNPTVTNIPANDTLCYGSKTTPVAFAGASTDYEWESGTHIDSIPTGPQTGNFDAYTVVNPGFSPLTTEITVSFQYIYNGISCSANDTSFYITVLPNPTVTNIPVNDTLCYGSQTTPVAFTGTATDYQWESGTHIDNIPDTQTGNFDAYTVVNPGSSLLTTNIKVTPQYLFNGVTCNGKDTGFSISVLPNLVATNIPANDTLCHGSATSAITFIGLAGSYQWESTTQIDSIPTGSQTGPFEGYTVVNTTSAPLTTHILVTPQSSYSGITCPGNDTSFSITVLPNPTITNIPGKDTLCYGSQTTMIAFTGASTDYQWEMGTQIDSIPTGLQTGDFGTYTVVNPGPSTFLTTDITVHFQYVYGSVSCSGNDTSFSISVLTDPKVTNIPENDTLCHGGKTKPVTFTGSADGYEWVSTAQIDSIPTGLQSVPFGEYSVYNTTGSPLTTIILVTPQAAYNGKICNGTDSSFTIVVLPEINVTGIPGHDTLCYGSKTTPFTFIGTATDYQWEMQTPLLDSIPTGAQTGNFGEYTLVNSGSSIATTDITVTPQYIYNGFICDGKDTSFSISVLPNLVATNIPDNDTLCHRSKTTAAVTFTGPANGYKWESSNLIDSIPTGTQMGDFGSYTVINTTGSPLTTKIIVTPLPYNGKLCNGNDTSFTIIVLPDPVITNIPANDTLCNGSKTTPVAFTGATDYQWEAIPSLDSIPTGVRTGDFEAYTVVNKGSSILSTDIKVIPQYIYNGVSCTGKDTSFKITVLPADPKITNIPANDTLCHGSKTTAVTFTGTANSYQWQSSVQIDSIPTGIQLTGTFGEYTVVNTTTAPLTTKIIVTPQSIYNGMVCNGKDTSFSITVNPLPVITNLPLDYTLCSNEQTDSVTFTGVFTSCQWENTGDALTGLPSGVQTGTFLKYTLVNHTDTVQIAIISVKAQYANGLICSVPDTSFEISVNPLPVVNQLPRDTVLCSGATTESFVFGGVATSYQWNVSGDVINGLPTGTQTGNFGAYTLNNDGAAPLTAVITVTPVYVNGGKTCLGRDSTFSITVDPVPDMGAVPADYALCSGDQTTSVTFGTSMVYEWEVSGDIIDGLPTGVQTGNFGVYTLVNKTAAPLTAIITVTPQYTNSGSSCTVKDTSFKITVNPEPSINNNTPDQNLCSGSETSEIYFSGTFTSYQWIATGNITGVPTGIQTGHFGEYTVENQTANLIDGSIIIDLFYNANGLNCQKQDTLFTIFVNPEPVLDNTLSDESLCDGEQTTSISFMGTATSYEWTASGAIPGMPAGTQTGDFGTYTLTNKTSSPLKSVITVTPKYAADSMVCDGVSKNFEVTVNPATAIISLTSNAYFFCEGDELIIEAQASGGNLVYRWYHDGTMIPGEQSNTYNVPSTSRSNSGIYYVEVSGSCGDATSSSVLIDVRGAKMLVQKWDDVILVDNSTYEFFGYQWYRDGILLVGATEQFYQEIGGLNGCYSVDLTMDGGGKIRSCERCFEKEVKSLSLSIYPNPIKQGDVIKANFDQGSKSTNLVSVEVFNANGQRILIQQINGNTVEVETAHLAPGIYVLRILTDDNQVYNEKIVVY